MSYQIKCVLHTSINVLLEINLRKKEMSLGSIDCIGKNCSLGFIETVHTCNTRVHG